MNYLEELKTIVNKELANKAYLELQSIKYMTKKQYPRHKHLVKFLKFIPYTDCLDCDTLNDLKLIIKKL